MENRGFPEVEVIPTEEDMEIITAILRANLRRIYKYAEKGPGSGLWFAGSMFRCIDVFSKIPYNRSTAVFLNDMNDKAGQLCDESITPKTTLLGFNQIINLAIGNLTTAFVSLLVTVKKKRRKR